ncbi:unnamed protein product [Zymoseptoria tritici ST99CH_3D1]|uniref:Uncharacterized protein n=2 Tax=Zymoseptoria tritici TaxID=1047171 RepID=A0A2H1G6C7_ZYMTR|nr:unnamed protein product [Zymoseptoria tritici ST99CH_1E4]SMR50309.1 unnamed protein product [Zymoseptoria tritici ST99CH_3D1]
MQNVADLQLHRRPVRTATNDVSIWSDIPQNDFRENLVKLERRTNAVPMDVLIAPVIHDSFTETDVLPLSVERQVADDLAYIAAVTEGAQSVAAVCLEQHIGSKLLVRVAGMDVMDAKIRDMLDKTARLLEKAATLLQQAETCKERMFALITEQHSQKLLGRMRSAKWQKPAYLRKTHKKPLVRDFENLSHRVQHAYPSKGEGHTRKTLVDAITVLSKEYERFESTNIEDELKKLKLLVRSTHDWCRNPDVRAFASKLDGISSPTPQVAAAVKTLRQLEKIGAYWRIASNLVDTATKFPKSFRRIEIKHVVPYAETPTEIAHESWAKVMHVHAEVQLVVEYAIKQQKDKEHDLQKSEGSDFIIWPRTIGTSKYLCYLCYLFLREYGGFGHALSSHGRLFDQWTVPDLEDYDHETREKLAQVLFRMNGCVVRHTEKLGEAIVWRPEPMTSRQNLLADLDISKEVVADEEVNDKLSSMSVTAA